MSQRPEADSSSWVSPTEPGGATRAEGPQVVTARQRKLLLAAVFLPVIGALLAWFSGGWPTWARVLATLWTLLVLVAALALAFDVFGPREQNPVPRAAGATVVATWPM